MNSPVGRVAEVALRGRNGGISVLYRFALLVSVLAVACSTARAASKNILLFVTDDMGLTAGCYGDANARTPHIDRLAAQGTRFTHAFCTTASCSPSRSVILTGRHNHSTGQYGLAHANHNFKSKGDVVSLPVMLSRAGYRTACIGKHHVEPRAIYAFDEYPNPRGGPRSPTGMAGAVRQFIEQDNERPFFLYVCTTDPHRAGKGFGNDRPYAGATAVKFDASTIKVPSFLPDRPDVRRDLADYYEAVARADQCLGAVLAALAETGHDSDTLVMFLSDNGIPFPGAKCTQYDPGTRLPLVVRLPNQKKPGTVSSAMVTWADLTPTLLEWAGVEAPKEIHGRSFLSIVEESDPPGWDEIYGSHSFHEVTMYYPMRTLRTRKYKYILNLAHQLPFPTAEDLFNSPTWQNTLGNDDQHYGKRTRQAFLHRPQHELYDLEADPDEAVNLAESREHAAVLAEMQKKLRAFQERTGDPWVIKYRHE
jgi:N-sulfoglucosamine sulfohydrolase